MRTKWASVVFSLLAITLAGLPVLHGSMEEYYELYDILQNNVVFKPNNSLDNNIQRLVGAFFPKQSGEPICVGIQYKYACVDGEEDDAFSCYDSDNALGPCMVCNATFLWTKADVGSRVATLLLAYHRGFSLRGFEWDKSCLVDSRTEVRLQDARLLSYNHSLMMEALADLTSQLKGFAAKKSIPDVDSSYRGYSIDWDSDRQDFRKYDSVFTSQVVVLSIFIVLVSLTTSNYLYGKLFQNVYDVKNRRSMNPAYPMYWSLVVVSILWNVAPSWLVMYHSRQVLYAVLATLPFLLGVAILVKKRIEFPIPFFKLFGCVFHFREKPAIKPQFCVWCISRHVVQVLSLWSLLVAFAFLAHYACAVILAFYLDPLGTLAKLLFIKAVVLAVILNVALLFTIDRPTYKCDRASLLKVLQMCLATLTVLSFLPILGYLMYVIGQVVFVNDSGSTWQSLLTLLPPLFLAVVSWYSHGLLFPDGVKDPSHPIKEIEDDLEGNNAHKDATDGGGGGGLASVAVDATPLLPHSGRKSLNESGTTDSSSGDGQAQGGGAGQRNYNSVSSRASEPQGKLS